MKNIYQIINGKASLGTAIEIPEGFTAYEIGKEPKELLKAIKTTASYLATKNELLSAKQYLDDTQVKFGGDYEPYEGEDLEAIKAKRSEARTLIRSYKGTEVYNEIFG